MASSKDLLIPAILGIALVAACDGGPADPAPLPPPSEWQWVELGLPADFEAEGVYVHPDREGVLFASDLQRSAWASFDDGATWTEVIGFGLNREAIQADPARPDWIWAGVWDTVRLSTDGGRTFPVRNTVARPIRSIHVSPLDGAVFVAPQWEPGDTPGIFRSLDDGVTFEFFPYGVEEGLRILTWDIEEDLATGALFLANEIADHPQPYEPPLLRSMDRGETWTDVTGPLFWHSQSLGMNREAGILYALLEGPGLWASEDLGRTWREVSDHRGGTSLLVDPFRPDHVYTGNLVIGLLTGGLYLSTSGGPDPRLVDFSTFTVSDIQIGPTGRKLYVVAEGGVYAAEIPERLR